MTLLSRFPQTRRRLCPATRPRQSLLSRRLASLTANTVARNWWTRCGRLPGYVVDSSASQANRTQSGLSSVSSGSDWQRTKTLRRLFTKEERETIGKVANPGRIENALRNLGKLAPKGSLPLFGGGMAIGHDPGGLGLVAGGLFGLGGLSQLAASGFTNLNFAKARNAMLGLPSDMLPVVPYLNPMGASAATLQERSR